MPDEKARMQDPEPIFYQNHEQLTGEKFNIGLFNFLNIFILYKFK